MTRELIDRLGVIKALDEAKIRTTSEEYDRILDVVGSMPTINRWIPVTERLPEELVPVNITWVNHNPESYYKHIKDKQFTATGVYFYGQWYWWSTLCTDFLAEYGHNNSDMIDNDIEITAWMPLPKPYEEGAAK